MSPLDWSTATSAGSERALLPDPVMEVESVCLESAAAGAAVSANEAATIAVAMARQRRVLNLLRISDRLPLRRARLDPDGRAYGACCRTGCGGAGSGSPSCRFGRRS